MVQAGTITTRCIYYRVLHVRSLLFRFISAEKHGTLHCISFQYLIRDFADHHNAASYHLGMADCQCCSPENSSVRLFRFQFPDNAERVQAKLHLRIYLQLSDCHQMLRLHDHDSIPDMYAMEGRLSSPCLRHGHSDSDRHCSPKLSGTERRMQKHPHSHGIQGLHDQLRTYHVPYENNYQDRRQESTMLHILKKGQENHW